MNAPGGRRFPAGFLWGAATSPTQIEGHLDNEWTHFTAHDGGNCRVACDSYHRYAEDVDWLARLGLGAYRLGIEWSRLQPGPGAPLDRSELDRYLDQLDRLRARGITPMVVLHHFSNPNWINAAGGWNNPAAIPAYVDYVTRLVAAIGGRVTLWNTFNEPDTYACMTCLLGAYPPRHQWRFRQFRRVIRHMARAHAQAGRIIRAAGTAARPMQVGIAKNWTFFEACRRFSPWDRAAAFIAHQGFNKFVLNAFLGGTRRRVATFLGLNYYGRIRFHHFQAMVPAGGTPRTKLDDFGFVCDDMVERYPAGLGKILAYFRRRFNLPVYITEHGTASTDEPFRAADLRENLTVLHDAIAAGANVKGFFYWSLLDNFEWQFGYTKKFGLLAVDFNDPARPRTPKPLAEAYARIARANALPAV